ncbi:MAG: methionyl-tRNA formyltransferase [Candidatus Riflebacteria bacterium]|nr:methionyl-tRNA formyltransferase [Candidatus Riflebacteria bacterium]
MMKIALLGNNLAAVKVFDAILDGGHEVFVVCPFGGKLHNWHASLFDHVHRRGVQTLFAPENVNHPLFLDELAAFAPDLMVCVYYNQAVRQPMLEIPRLGCVNVHPSLLPAYRGTAPLVWAIINGETRTGVTFHKMTARYEEGEILLQRSLEIGPDETGYELHQRAAVLVDAMFREFVADPERHLAAARPQTGTPSGYTAADGNRNQLDWTATARTLHNAVRALAPPLPGARGQFDGLRCFLDRTRLPAGAAARMDGQRLPGEIFDCGTDGTVRVLRPA